MNALLLSSKHKVILLSEYVFIYFKREEMDRYGWFISDSSVRSNLDWPRFLEIEIPLIPMDKQIAISQLFHCVQEQIKISDEMKTVFDGIWPSIIQSMTK